MKKAFKIIFYVVCAVIFCASLLVIDYSVTKIWGRGPIFAIKKENKYEQYNEYSGITYKMWICTSEKNHYVMGKYNDKAPECSKQVKFDAKGEYTTYSDLKITYNEYNTISSYYEYGQLSYWNQLGLDDALYVATKLKENSFTTKEGYYSDYYGTNYIIGMFNKLTDNGWKYMTDDVENHYCIKSEGDKILRSKYVDGRCDGNFKELEFDEKWCELVIKTNANENATKYYDIYCN